MPGLLRLLFGVAVLVTACATTGPKFSEHPESTTAVPADSARLIVFLPTEKGGWAQSDPTVLIDGSEVGVIEWSAYRAFALSPGKHQVVARYKTWSGLCEVSVYAPGGSRQYLEVSPFIGSVTPSEAVAAVALLPVSIFPPPINLAHLAARAVDASRNKCGGFPVQLVDEATARSMLDELRASR